MGVFKCASLVFGLCGLLVAGSAQACTGDTDGSGAVDQVDLANVLASFGIKGRAIVKTVKSTGANPDVNGDLIVNGMDVQSVLTFWGLCPADSCTSDFNDDGVVNSVDLGTLLASGVADSVSMALLLNEFGMKCSSNSKPGGPSLLTSTTPSAVVARSARGLANAMKASN